MKNLLESQKYRNKIKRINTKIRKLRKTFGDESKQVEDYFKIVTEHKIELTKGGYLSSSPKYKVDNTILTSIDEIKSYGEIAKYYRDYVGLSKTSDIIVHKKIDDELIPLLEDVKEYRYLDLLDEKTLEKGYNPILGTATEKQKLIEKLNAYKEQSKYGGKLQPGATIEYEDD